MTLGLAFTLNTLQERVEQLAAAQLQTANDVSKLQAAEQEIRRSLSTLNQRPAAAARSKPKTPVAPAPPTEPH